MDFHFHTPRDYPENVGIYSPFNLLLKPVFFLLSSMCVFSEPSGTKS